MSERASFRGRGTSRAGGGGETHRGGRGGAGGAAGAGAARGGSGGGGHGQQAEKPKKENILDLTKYMDKEITVKFNGGREGTGPFARLFLSLFYPCPLCSLRVAFSFSSSIGYGRAGQARPFYIDLD